MGSRREEERNEKIIRGLMKLPPNRKCINCNSLGPQYVCTNFWTFVCMTCSGIHREFTHRVKSVSMAKFTTQEVEALQNGGNQRAREAYLKDWDPQNQRFPNSSNADKVREFIKNVYVDKKYAGGKNSEKPPRDVQSIRSQEEETRRASSYHSYSQSPPYDYQYEERRYGKPGAALTRKPGSDRGLYDRKMSSFVYSPGRRGEQVHEDMFANEGSGARVSDYSASSGGALSPNFQRATGYGSPPLQPPRSDSNSNLNRQTSNLSSEANFRSGADRIPQRQRTSSGSFGSFDSNSMSIKSFNSGSLADVPEPEMVHGTQQDTVSTVSLSATPGRSGLDPFQVPSGAKTAASTVDLFQAPATFSAPSLDLFQSSTLPVPPIQSQIPQAATPTPLDLFADFPQHSLTSEKAVPEPSLPKNEGWATFDSPQPSASTSATASSTHVEKPTIKGDTTENIDMLSRLNSWPSLKESPFQNSPSDVSHAWDDSLVKAQAPTIMSNVQPWNAFGEASLSIPLTGINQIDEPPAAIPGHPIPDQYSAYDVSLDFSGIPKSTVAAETLPSHGSAAGYKSSNPFDFPFDTDTEQCNMFFDMSSLQAALPEPQLPSSLLGGVSDPWFPQDTVTPFASTAPQGGLAYLAGQTATPIPNVPVQGPLASVGGNPFA